MYIDIVDKVCVKLDSSLSAHMRAHNRRLLTRGRAEVRTVKELPLSHSHGAQATQGTLEVQTTSTLQIKKYYTHLHFIIFYLPSSRGFAGTITRIG